MAIINVVWPIYHPETCRRGSWDSGMLEDLFAGRLGPSRNTYFHRNSFAELPFNYSGAVVVISGQHHASDEDIAQINRDIDRLGWLVFILLGDEESQFDITRLKHPNMRIWTQSRESSLTDKVSHHLLWGYPQDTGTLVQVTNKSLDWFFSGQVTHPRRQQCIQALCRCPGKGVVNPTLGFTQGYLRPQYYKLLASAKLAPCPAGVRTPDSFRVCEALEAGCIPIVDSISSRPGNWAHWWNILLEIGEVPFPVINDWNELPDIIAEQLKQWSENSVRVMLFWELFKLRMVQWMEKDIDDLSQRL